MPNDEQPLLPGFEFMLGDQERYKEDKRLKKEILKLITEMASKEKEYNSPAKLATWERDLKALMQARKNLWNSKQNDGG